MISYSLSRSLVGWLRVWGKCQACMWSNIIESTRSRFTHLQLQSGKDGDHPEDSYVSRTLRQYYLEKYHSIPDWLQDTRKQITQPLMQPAATSTSNVAGASNRPTLASNVGNSIPRAASAPGTRPKANLRDILHRQDPNGAADRMPPPSPSGLSARPSISQGIGRTASPQGLDERDRLRPRVRGYGEQSGQKGSSPAHTAQYEPPTISRYEERPPQPSVNRLDGARRMR